MRQNHLLLLMQAVVSVGGSLCFACFGAAHKDHCWSHCGYITERFQLGGNQAFPAHRQQRYLRCWFFCFPVGQPPSINLHNNVVN